MSKRLVTTGTTLYDNKGKMIGYAVEEREVFTAEELRPVTCAVCGGINGNHKEYWVSNVSQSGFGEVEGQWLACPHAGK